MVSAVIIIVRTFQLIPRTAIEPTTQDPARPTGSITSSDWPILRVRIARTRRETVRLIAVELTIEEISPERRFESNRASGMAIWPAMRDMYAHTGSALLMSAGTTICGFMVLLLSPIPVIRDFGVVSSISVAFSLILALLVLPGLLAAEVRTNGNGS